MENNLLKERRTVDRQTDYWTLKTRWISNHMTDSLTRGHRQTVKMTNGKEHWQIYGLLGTQNDRRTETNRQTGRQTDKKAERKVRLTEKLPDLQKDKEMTNGQKHWPLDRQTIRQKDRPRDIQTYWYTETDRQIVNTQIKHTIVI